MATNYTTNYQLNQWEPTDAVQRVEFNQDNAKMDAALKALSDQVLQKANQSALNTLISSVNQKADVSTVSSLSSLLNSEISQRQAADSSLQTALALKGNCQIYYGTYTGDGQDTRTLTFPGKPLLVVAMGDYLILHALQGVPMAMCHNHTGYSSEQCATQWSGNSFTWTGISAYHLNNQGKSYQVVALMAADK